MLSYSESQFLGGLCWVSQPPSGPWISEWLLQHGAELEGASSFPLKKRLPRRAFLQLGDVASVREVSPDACHRLPFPPLAGQVGSVLESLGKPTGSQEGALVTL